MDASFKLAFLLPVISVLVSCGPAQAWYKQAGRGGYYSVGRASGLLSGIQRAPYTRRAQPEPPDSRGSAPDNVASKLRFLLKTMPLCIKDITPNLHNCERFQDSVGLFQCEAEVFLTLDPSDCTDD
ncbi:neuropeptide B-like [Lampris incognitus]|uniref:neuropeptide B-like n=1 Tax=Lampris incognitus TaxID=2546036 RepID=UPI0024B633AB|nr:neuropeptide B-like [Lampris incognitus]